MSNSACRYGFGMPFRAASAGSSTALVVAGEEAAQAADGDPVGLLYVVEAAVIGLPDVHQRTGQRLTARTDDPAGDEDRAQPVPNNS
jgi:hypothetical protein